MLQRHVHDNGVVTYQAESLRDLGVPHAFSTRIGGVSEGRFATLNLGELTKEEAPDDNANVAENFRRFRSAIGTVRHFRIAARQVHGASVWVTPPRPVKARETPEADAILSDVSRGLVVVRTADCVPVLLASPDGTVVAAVHAGWRGIVAGVVPATLRALRERFATPPSTLTAAIGPSISADAFEVGEEVRGAFDRLALSEAVHPTPNKPHVDLRHAIARQLQRAGVEPGAVESTDRCTYHDEAEFYSYRRDGRPTGSMAGAIAPVEHR